jgi:RimJ/RimL family protein N-acetyltransferase
VLAVLLRREVPTLRCRSGGEHVAYSERLRVSVARVSEIPEALGLLDDVASYWQGWDPSTASIPPVRDINPWVWFTANMEFLARCRLSGSLVATISLYERDGGGYHIGGTVHPVYRGQGYGREALALVCLIAHRHLGIPDLIAGCEVTNEASRRWLASCGFAPTAGPPLHQLPNGRVIQPCWWRHADRAMRRCRNEPWILHD